MTTAELILCCAAPVLAGLLTTLTEAHTADIAAGTETWRPPC